MDKTDRELLLAIFQELREFKSEMSEFKEDMLGFKKDMLEFKEDMLEFKEDMLGFKKDMLGFRQETEANFKKVFQKLKDEKRLRIKHDKDVKQRFDELFNALDKDVMENRKRIEAVERVVKH